MKFWLSISVPFTNQKSEIFDKIRAISPFNLEIVITETKDANKFLLLAANIIESSKEKLSTAIKEEVIIEEKKKIEVEEQEKENNLKIAALEAQAQVKEAEAALQKLSSDAPIAEREKLELDVKLAKFKANIAFEKAGLPKPYEDVF